MRTKRGKSSENDVWTTNYFSFMYKIHAFLEKQKGRECEAKGWEKKLSSNEHMRNALEKFFLPTQNAIKIKPDGRIPTFQMDQEWNRKTEFFYNLSDKYQRKYCSKECNINICDWHDVLYVDCICSSMCEISFLNETVDINFFLYVSFCHSESFHRKIVNSHVQCLLLVAHHSMKASSFSPILSLSCHLSISVTI